MGISNKNLMIIITLGIIISLLVVLIVSFVILNLSPTQKLELASTAFENGNYIPAEYTCKGSDIPPPLSVTGVSSKAITMALIFEDPDAVEVVGYTWIHWIMWNISPQTTSFGEENLPLEASQGTNSLGQVGYQGPCPPAGRDHAYYFRLYVLNTELTLSSSATKQNLLTAMEGHIIQETYLMGRFAN
jgi:Raf kinase inhibitor-like YbhB/YbcL family protein